MKKKTFAFFITIAFIITGCSYKVLRGGFVNYPLIDEIKRDVEKISGLNFKRDVEIEIIDRKELRAYLKKVIREGLSDDYLIHLGISFQLLGLLPEGFDLEEKLLEFYEDQALGFYDHRNGKLYLVRGAKGGGLMVEFMQMLLQKDIIGEFILSHELFHALQDQHYPMDEIRSKNPRMDALLASDAIVEGSAMIVSIDHTLHLFHAEGVRKRITPIFRQYALSMDVPEGIPRPLYNILLFPYIEGFIFTESVLEKEGWRGIHRFLEKPPATTRKVLHPESGHIEPPFITSDIYKDLNPPHNWMNVWNNTLGEFISYELLRNYLSDDEAKRGSEGWNGDIIKLFKEGGRWLVLWILQWETERDADEFFQSFRKIIEKRFPEGELEGYLKGRRAWWNISGSYTFIKREGLFCFIGIGYPNIPDKLMLFHKKDE